MHGSILHSRSHRAGIFAYAGVAVFTAVRVRVHLWPMAGAPVGEIEVALLTFKALSDRPVWADQFRESAVAYESEGALRCRPVDEPASALPQVTDSRGLLCGRPTERQERQSDLARNPGFPGTIHRNYTKHKGLQGMNTCKPLIRLVAWGTISGSPVVNGLASNSPG
ncbi:MAG: hypothetical protein ACRC2B_03865 [Rubrivivax sp.]